LPQGWAIDLSRIGNDLGVGYAIEGSVQQATFSLWINARLFDAQNGVHAWVDASIATTATFLGTG
jgi:TolB-like protein